MSVSEADARNFLLLKGNALLEATVRLLEEAGAAFFEAGEVRLKARLDQATAPLRGAMGEVRDQLYGLTLRSA